MKKRILTFHRLLAQYNRYLRKLDRISNGKSRYSRKDLLVKRLHRLYTRLISMKERYRLASVQIALAGGLFIGSAGVVSAQNLSFKTDNALGLAHIENNPKPVLIDWDEDGDLDLFIGGRLTTTFDASSAGVNYYTNNGGFFSHAESPFPQDLGIDGVGADPFTAGDSTRVNVDFIDLDADGDMDAFIGQSNGTLIYYRNDDGSMVKADGADNPFDGVVVDDDSHAHPAFVDGDGDGDLDAVIGKYSGAIAYFKNENGAFVQQNDGADDPNPFADVNVTNRAAPTFVDWDADGDMDLFVGNKIGELAYFRNDDGTFVATDAAENPFGDLVVKDEEFDMVPTFGDVDMDGDLDLIYGVSTGMLYYMRNDGGTFTSVPRNTIGIATIESGSIDHAFVDIDADGDQDVVAGNGDGFLQLFTNTDGSFTEMSEHAIDMNTVKVGYIASPAFADIDTDGDMDLFLGSYQSNITYFANDAGAFMADEMGNPFAGLDPGDNENIAFIDMDGDGDMDACIGNKLGEVKYFVNTDQVFAEAPDDNPFKDVLFEVEGQVNHPVQPAFTDMDGDGDMDAYFGQIDGSIRVFENMGDAGRGSAVTFTELTGGSNPFNEMDFGRAASPAFGDIDGDGDMDLLISNAAGITFHFENGGISTAANDFQFSEELNVFPNPTTNNIQVEMPWIRSEARIQIMSVNGRLLSERITTAITEPISLSGLPGGMYLIKVESAEGQAIKRVWKQ
ncbi:MAG: T9SS type A sorting domain-containing protein [Saprospiraceae bacterium]|nr:T9SS type A sorting domain-containing protein [Saprospiraceae bacterium]